MDSSLPPAHMLIFTIFKKREIMTKELIFENSNFKLSEKFSSYPPTSTLVMNNEMLSIGNLFLSDFNPPAVVICVSKKE